MLVVRKDDASVRVPCRLLTSTAVPVTGMLPANLNDTTGVGNISMVKADGSLSSLAMVNGVNWIEVDALRFPGLYHIVLTASETDVVGTMQLGVQANAAEFIMSVVSVDVEEFHIATEVARNGWKIETAGPDANRLVIYASDGVTVLYRFDLKGLDGNPTIISPFERTPV